MLINIIISSLKNFKKPYYYYFYYYYYYYYYYHYFPDLVIECCLKGKYYGVFVSLVKSDEIRPSISCQIILE